MATRMSDDDPEALAGEGVIEGESEVCWICEHRENQHGPGPFGSCHVPDCGCRIVDTRVFTWRDGERIFLCSPPEPEGPPQEIGGPIRSLHWAADLLGRTLEGPTLTISARERQWLESLPPECFDGAMLPPAGERRRNLRAM